MQEITKVKKTSVPFISLLLLCFTKETLKHEMILICALPSMILFKDFLWDYNTLKRQMDANGLPQRY